MSYTTDMYSAILADMNRGDASPGSLASRKKDYPNGASIVFAIDVITMRREAYILMAECPDSVQFPRWRGISIDIAKLPVYGSQSPYVRLIQLPESEDYIFDLVIDDLCQSVCKTESLDACLPTVLRILTKWKKFFQSDRPLVMSDEMQEGLYGELTFLRQLIGSQGTQVVLNWVGGERETHDFYFNDYTIEVKTTSRKEPYSFLISSEYQLDASDAQGHLFMYALALKKSKQAGMKIPELIQDIRNELAGDGPMLNQFDDKLLHYGYVAGLEDMYNLGFSVRDRFVFEVTEQFPRIIRSMYRQGVSKVSYEILASQCMPFSKSEDYLFNALKGGGQNAQ